MLDKIQQSLFEAAIQKRDACIQITKTWDEFMEGVSQKKLILAPWFDEEDVEKDVKARTKGDVGAAKTLCSPFDQPELPEGTKCFAFGKPAKKVDLLGQDLLEHSVYGPITSPADVCDAGAFGSENAIELETGLIYLTLKMLLKLMGRRT